MKRFFLFVLTFLFAVSLPVWSIDWSSISYIGNSNNKYKASAPDGVVINNVETRNEKPGIYIGFPDATYTGEGVITIDGNAASYETQGAAIWLFLSNFTKQETEVIAKDKTFYIYYEDGVSIERGDVTIFVYTTDNPAPQIHYWNGNDPTYNPSQGENDKADFTKMANNWYYYTFYNAYLNSGVSYNVYYPSNSTWMGDQTNVKVDTYHNNATHPTLKTNYNDVVIRVKSATQPKIYFWGGGDQVTDYPTWGNEPNMEQDHTTTEANWYTYTIPNVDAAYGINYKIRLKKNDSEDWLESYAFWTNDHACFEVAVNNDNNGVTDSNYGTCPLLISDLTLTSSTSLELFAGNTSQIAYTTSSTGAVTYSGYDTNVITVSKSGLITVVAAGTATITVSQDADATYAAGEKTITVNVTAVSPYCEKVTYHLNSDAETNSKILLSIGSDGAGRTIVTAKIPDEVGTKRLDYLQVTGKGSVTSVAGETAMSVSFATPAADGEGNITLEILWSKLEMGGNWMVQNMTVPANVVCASAVEVAPPAKQYCSYSGWDTGGDRTSLTWQTESNGDVSIVIGNGTETNVGWRNGGLELRTDYSTTFRIYSGENYSVNEPCSSYFDFVRPEDRAKVITLRKKNDIVIPVPSRIVCSPAAYSWLSDVAGDHYINPSNLLYVYEYGAVCGQLAAPTNVAVNSTTNVITFDAVDGATGYTANIYNTSSVLVHSETVTSGSALTYNPFANGVFTVKVIAVGGGGFSDSPESDGATWNYTFVMPASIWCEKAGVVTAKNHWGDAHFTINTLADGNVTIVITSPNGTAANYRNTKGMNGTFKLNGTTAEFETYFTGSKTSDDTFTLALKDPANKPAIGSVIDYSGQIECATSQHGDDYSDYNILGYRYGTECASSKVTVSANVNPAASGTVAITVNSEPVTKVESGTSVTFTATPAAHYRFVRWSDEAEDAESVGATRVVTVTEDIVLTAIFARSEYVMSATSNDGSMGTAAVKQNGTDVTSVDAGTSVTFIATPTGDYVFDSWTNAGGEVVSYQSTFTVSSVNADYELIANFDVQRQEYCEYEIVNTGGHKFYLTLSKAPAPYVDKYMLLVEGSEETQITAINNANTAMNNVTNSAGGSGTDVPFTKENGGWTFSSDNYGSATCIFGIAPGKTWKDVKIWRPDLYLATNHGQQTINQEIINIIGKTEPSGWKHSVNLNITCVDNEAPVLEPTKVEVLSESSVKLTLLANDDRDFIRYTITGFDGDPVVINAASGVREYYTVSGLEPNYPYAITIKAEDKAGNFDTEKLTVTATPDATAPFNVKASAMALSLTDVLITASADEDRTSDVTYNIYSADGTQLLATCHAAPGETATYKFSGLTANTTYTYQVGALNFAGVEATPRITVAATTYGEDLALNKPAAAGMGQVHGQISNANDGNYKTAWSSNNNGSKDIAKDWWKVDLGSICVIDNIRILWERAYPGDYVLQVSDSEAAWNSLDDSDTDWTTIQSYNVAPTKFAWNENIQTISKDDYMTDYSEFAVRAKGRYVRIKVQSTSNAYVDGIYGICMYCFEVYGRSTIAGGAEITNAEVCGVTAHSVTMDVVVDENTTPNDYVIVMDATHGINQRCKIVAAKDTTYNGAEQIIDVKHITVTGLSAATTYQFTMIAVDAEGKESNVYPATAPNYVEATTLKERPNVPAAPQPPLRNGRDFRSIYSDVYKSALMNPNKFGKASWISVNWEEEFVEESHHILYSYNGNNRQAVWGFTGSGAESFLARDGSDGDPIFPHLNYTNKTGGTGVDVHEMEKLHIDIWSNVALPTITICLGDNELVNNLSHNGSGWVSYDIVLPTEASEITRLSLNDLRWMKIQGFDNNDHNCNYWAIDNVYFYKDVNYTGYYEVRVKSNLRGAGTPTIVESAGANVNEDVFFAQPAPNQETLTFVANPNEANGYFFVKWTNDDIISGENVVSTEDSLSQTIEHSIHYTANYERRYKIKPVAKNIGKDVTGTATATYTLNGAQEVQNGDSAFVPNETVVTFTATETSPYVFKYWALDGKFYSAGANDGNHTVQITVDERDYELRAIYDKIGAAFESTVVETGYPVANSADGQLKVSYIYLGTDPDTKRRKFRILVEGTDKCNITGGYNNFNFYIHNVYNANPRAGEDGKSFPASEWNKHVFPYGNGYTYIDFEAKDTSLIKIDADRNYIVLYKNGAEGGVNGRDLVECKLPAMGINWYNVYDFKYPLAVKEATEGAGITWSSAAWFNTEGTSVAPNDDKDIFILSPMTVDVANARAKSVTICKDFNGQLTGHGVISGMVDESNKPNFAAQKHNGHLTINANGALQVVKDIKVAYSANFYKPEPTEPEDILIEAAATGSGALIFNNADGKAGATAGFYTKGNNARGDEPNWQWMATPFNAQRAQNNYDGSWSCPWDNTTHAWGDYVRNETPMQPFVAYAHTQEAAGLRMMTGTLVSTADQNIALDWADAGRGAVNIIGNSWVAPINIGAFTESDFVHAEATITMLNTGYDPYGSGSTTTVTMETAVDSRTGGEYVSIPINIAKNSTKLPNSLKVIPAMQGFQVKARNNNASNSNGRLHLHYDRLVRVAGNVNIQEMRAPGRAAADEEENPITDEMTIIVGGSRYYDVVRIYENPNCSYAFDNGWDALKEMSSNADMQQIFVRTDAKENYEISTHASLNGTILGFYSGEDTNNTMTFRYEGDHTYYLYDSKTDIYHIITDGATITFPAMNTSKLQKRFLITDDNPYAQNPGVATGIINLNEDGNALTFTNSTHQTMIIRIFDAAGRLCSETVTDAPMYEAELPTGNGAYLIQAAAGSQVVTRKVVR